eukprot:scaffold2323_cov329-Prasinococcus_capsulatus_cf.AAC.10
MVFAAMERASAMALFWLHAVEEIRWHWQYRWVHGGESERETQSGREGSRGAAVGVAHTHACMAWHVRRQPIPRVDVEQAPQLNYCLIHQKLQLINCCIARLKRRVGSGRPCADLRPARTGGALLRVPGPSLFPERASAALPLLRTRWNGRRVAGGGQACHRPAARGGAAEGAGGPRRGGGAGPGRPRPRRRRGQWRRAGPGRPLRRRAARADALGPQGADRRWVRRRRGVERVRPA